MNGSHDGDLLLLDLARCSWRRDLPGGRREVEEQDRSRPGNYDGRGSSVEALSQSMMLRRFLVLKDSERHVSAMTGNKFKYRDATLHRTFVTFV